MLQLSVLGHIGADARIEQANGKNFVSFNVAHSERWTGADGVQHDSTTWVSCALNGDGGNILPYLRKGQCVYVSGRCSTRVYSSPKLRQMVAGLNLSVDKIELVGAQPEPVPRELVADGGALLRVTKYYQVSPVDCAAANVDVNNLCTLTDRAGRQYQMQAGGWVTPIRANEQTEQNTEYNGY